MFIQCNNVKRNGKVSKNRKLAESYREPGSKTPRVRTVMTIESLPIEERAKIIYNNGGQKHLTTEEWKVLHDLGLLKSEDQSAFEVGDVYRGAGTAIAYKHLKQSGLFGSLNKIFKGTVSRVLRELIVNQLLYPVSKLNFIYQRKSSLLYLLEGKNSYKEDIVYKALDQLASKFELLKQELNGLIGNHNSRLLFYDLSNSYFTGTKAELGGRGQSKEKRFDRHIVSYGLVMNENNMPLDIKVWKGGTADANTVLETFTDWKKVYQYNQSESNIKQQAIWIADRSMSGEETLKQVCDLGLNYITGLPGNTQKTILKLKREQAPQLFDKFGITSVEHEGKRLVLCRHESKGYRRERQAFARRRKVYEELKHIQNTKHNKNKEKIYHRAMRVLETYEQTNQWEIEVESFPNKKEEIRYRLVFKLNRKEALEQDKIGHYYLLQTDLDQNQISDSQIVEGYRGLSKVEKSFRDIKSHIQIRPIRHWKERRIKAHIYLCYLSLWLSKYIENQWRQHGKTNEVSSTLNLWDLNLLLCEKVAKNGSIVELNWNQGKNALKAKKEIGEAGELDALKLKW